MPVICVNWKVLVCIKFRCAINVLHRLRIPSVFSVLWNSSGTEVHQVWSPARFL